MCNVQVDEAQGTHSNVVLIARIVFVALETITLFCIPIPLSYPTSDFIPTFIFQTLPRDEEISDAIAIEYSRSGRTTAIKSATRHRFSLVFCSAVMNFHGFSGFLTLCCTTTQVPITFQFWLPPTLTSHPPWFTQCPVLWQHSANHSGSRNHAIFILFDANPRLPSTNFDCYDSNRGYNWTKIVPKCP